MRPNAVPRALNGQPFQTADARALGVSWKTLQGSRFRRLAKGIYVDAASTNSYRLQVRGVMLALPPGTIAIGVTGLQLLGVDIGCPLPMIFATIHQRQVRRRDVKVMRVKELPPHVTASPHPSTAGWLQPPPWTSLTSSPPEIRYYGCGEPPLPACSRRSTDTRDAVSSPPGPR